MGDRANVAVKQFDSMVFLYTHWGGEDLPQTLRTALQSKAGQARKDDGQYLARIIFDAMVGDDQGGETGFGITARCGDGDYRVLLVDCDEERVSRTKVVRGAEGKPDTLATPSGTWTFAEFSALTDEQCGQVWGDR